MSISWRFDDVSVPQSVLIPSAWFGQFVNKIRRKKHVKNKYKVIEQKLLEDPDWPPLGGITMATQVSPTNIQFPNT